MRRILITGASGFLARHLLTSLRLRDQALITGASRFIPRFASGFDRFERLDFQDPSKTNSLIEAFQPTWIFHLAGTFRGTHRELYEGNLLSTVTLLEAVARYSKHSKTLLVGSAAEYGFSALNDGFPISEDTVCHPAGPYATSKWAMTQYALDQRLQSGLHLNIVRPFNLIGPGIPPSLLLGAIIDRATKAVAQNLPGIIVGNTSSERDFLSVRDAAEACVRLMEREIDGEIINWIVETALQALPGNLTYQVDPSLVRASDPKRVIGNNSKASRLLEFVPQTDLSESLRSACAAALATAHKT